MNLFRYGEFLLASGQVSSWKVDCDALTGDDWGTLAWLAADLLPPFSAVEGVPTGGEKFARALANHVQPGGVLLIADDVWTTGQSWHHHRGARLAYGVVAFARQQPEPFVRALFTFNAAAPPVAWA